MNNITYYNENYDKYISESFKADMSLLYNEFEKYLNVKDIILDLGCGSGRDSLYFHNKGYNVISLDGSIKIIEHLKIILKNEIVFSTFEEYKTDKKFDGIWACASLLHVKKESMEEILLKYIDLLSVNGIFFISFKLRDNNFSNNGRVFTCFTENSLKILLNKLLGIEIIKFIETKDVRKNRENEKWISVIIKRIK
ncbi:class I SAM-dependent methyltransferase [Clostridiaceae bacterium HSG29]|nr:class I SAM-dependent methyltransferase [Clostridiaceae bacterium HSG29]